MFEFNPEKFENNYSTPVETKDGKSVLIVAQSFEDEQCKIDLVIGRIENSLELVEWKLVDNCYVYLDQDGTRNESLDLYFSKHD